MYLVEEEEEVVSASSLGGDFKLNLKGTCQFLG